ncbi:MAG TPA: isoamylase early set domain-containing protein [Deltaproteobacteria bacterium]|nr:isoamylase early set domain-containing protein [Deltaproteobacteria bacterium]
MSLKKQYLKSKSQCKVTFSLPKEAVGGAKQVTLVGDFNDWDTTATPMKKQKDGGVSVTLSLDLGREYQFRYLIDGTRWENDWCAEKYVPSALGGADNSVLVL